MWETVAIIVALGGLEWYLWSRSERKRDQEADELAVSQEEQKQLLEDILITLSIQPDKKEPPVAE